MNWMKYNHTNVVDKYKALRTNTQMEPDLCKAYVVDYFLDRKEYTGMEYFKEVAYIWNTCGEVDEFHGLNKAIIIGVVLGVLVVGAIFGLAYRLCL